ncbi:MAG: tyrosine-type recombinase/integrase [Myxococcales bacterium]|nr:tyrosine-type recombinase/integrase [Myxococcales bacterium]
MPRPALGEIRRTTEGYVTIVRVTGGKRQSFSLPTCRTDAEAEARSAMVAGFAARLRRRGLLDSRAEALLRTVAEASDTMLGHATQIVSELLGDKLDPISAEPAGPTFAIVADEWTKGVLHERFPDHVERLTERFRDTVEKRLAKAIVPILGSKPIREVTRAHCEDVMRRLPVPKTKSELSRETRRQYAGLMHRVLNLAELAGYIDRNPLPRGWLPKPGKLKRFPILLPYEDEALLACQRIPVCYRVLWGVLHREGSRREEAVELTWREVDLQNGVVDLDENKTDHARFWKLSPGVRDVLTWWRELRGGCEPDDRVFVDEHGRPLQFRPLADLCRAHLVEAGLDRADLFTAGPNKEHFGPHCYRRSFVTRSLANGQTEDWVRQRTGHTSSQLYRYRQAARALAELDLGEVLPLDQAIPEFRAVLRNRVAPAPVAELDPALPSGSQHHLIATRTTREGGGTGRRTSLRC